MPITSLKPEQLYTQCDASRFDFKTTSDLQDLSEMVGQDRAMEALRFGVGIQREGYNIFALGSSGMGKHSLIRQYVEGKAKQKKPADDWCYVNNFKHDHQPKAIALPNGKGVQLRKDMHHLIEELLVSIPAKFESDEYREQSKQIESAYQEWHEKSFAELQDNAEKESIVLLRTPTGFAFAPSHGEETVTPEEYEKLPEDEQKKIEQVITVLQVELEKIISELPKRQRASRNQVKQLNKTFTQQAVTELFEDLSESYCDLPAVLEYFQQVQQDMIENVDLFRHGREERKTNVQGVALTYEPDFGRYEVNLLVEHNGDDGAPIIYEDSPLYQNLVGRVEHVSQLGALVTDFTLIKAGALHRANGGYLILDINKILQQPYAWEGLKRALKAREVRMESLGQIYSVVNTVSLEPEPIPLDLKVILLGDRYLYYILQEYDPEFCELFKVAVDFEEEIARTKENDFLYARMMATMIRKESLLPFDRGAVARVIEYSARMVEDSERLTTHLRSIGNLLQEADYWAAEAGHAFVLKENVEQAIDAQIRRANQLQERSQDEVLRNTIRIETSGEAVGQANALTVIQLGEFAFGRPSRVTATASIGDGDVVDIEREVELGGSLHSKGVLILSAYLSSQYAQHRPLSMSASIVFEQSYGGIDGDSATVAELCVLLSAIAELPLKQNLAITGSADQHGWVQAIGGVNEKIEGFFDLCQSRGLTGDQGVIIPFSNIVHLMLRHDVVEAVKEGRFHIYAVNKVDEVMELLTGLPAGSRDEKQEFPEKTFNHLVDQQLFEYSELKRHAEPEPEKESEKEGVSTDKK